MGPAKDSHQHACHRCDYLFSLPSLVDHQSAYCPRCAQHLTTYRANNVQLALALSTSGLLLLLCATAYPFLGFAKAGQMTTMTLLDSATSLFAFDQPVLGSIVFVFILFAPGALLALLTLLLTMLHYELRHPRLPQLARLVRFLSSWNMVEVFLIGVLVSVAKISSMASIQIGFAFWAFIGFTLCIIASVSLLDEVQMWRAISRLLSERPQAHVDRGVLR